MDSICSTNFPMNAPSDPIMPSLVLSLSKFGAFTQNVVNCLISPTTHSAFRLLLWLSIFPLITLVRMACSSAANIKLSVSRFCVPFRNHCHLSWFPTFLVCHTNWPCNIFSSQEIVLSSFFCLLASIVVFQISSIKSISTDLAALSRRSLDSFT